VRTTGVRSSAALAPRLGPPGGLAVAFADCIEHGYNPTRRNSAPDFAPMDSKTYGQPTPTPRGVYRGPRKGRAR
jgi:hypothetical protein